MNQPINAKLAYTYSVVQLGPRKVAILRGCYGSGSGRSMMTPWEVVKTYTGSDISTWDRVEKELKRLRETQGQ